MIIISESAVIIASLHEFSDIDNVTHGLCVILSVGPFLENSVEHIRSTETVAFSHHDVACTRTSLWLHGVQFLLDLSTGALENRTRDCTVTELIVATDRVRQSVNLSSA